jgi:hypothetical protein
MKKIVTVVIVFGFLINITAMQCAATENTEDTSPSTEIDMLKVADVQKLYLAAEGYRDNIEALRLMSELYHQSSYFLEGQKLSSLVAGSQSVKAFLGNAGSDSEKENVPNDSAELAPQLDEKSINGEFGQLIDKINEFIK